MSKTQWRRFQRNKKTDKEIVESSNKPYQSRVSYQTKKPVGRQLFSLKQVKSKGKEKEEVPSKEDELVTDNFESGLEDDLDMLCNMVSVLPREYDCAIEVSEPTSYVEEEMMNHKPVCYFVMNNGFIKEHNTFFRNYMKE